MTQAPPPDDGRGQSTMWTQTMWAVRRHVTALLLLAFVMSALVGGVTRLQPNTYVSTVSLVVQTTSGASDTETLIRTMQALVNSEIIGADLAQATGVQLTADEVVDRISVRRPPGAGVFTVAVTDTDEARSRVLADELVPAFEDRVDELSQPEPGQLAVNYSVRPWASGLVNTTVVSPPVTRNAVLGFGLGVLLGLLLRALQARRRPVLLTPQHAAESVEIPLLGAVPRLFNGARDADVLDVVLQTAPGAGWPAAPRRVLILVAGSVRDAAPAVLAVASSLQRHGTVVLIDADRRSSSLTGHLGLRRRPGLSEALHDKAPGDHLTAHGDGPLRVLSLGREPGEVTANGTGIAGLIQDLAADGIVAVVAEPGGVTPWLAVLDAVDAVLVLTTLRRTRVDEAGAVRDALLVCPDKPAVVLALEHNRILTSASVSFRRPTGAGTTWPVEPPAEAPSRTTEQDQAASTGPEERPRRVRA